MLNKEKYDEELMNLIIDNLSFAVDQTTGKIVNCNNVICKKCVFHAKHLNETCTDCRRKWLNSEYVEPSIDWSKVAVDTPILVRNYPENDWKRRYFAEYKNSVVYAWQVGTTSWTADGETNCWSQAKLAESEE